MINNSYYLGNRNLPTPSTTFEYTEKEIKALSKCANSIEHFANHYFTIVTEDGKEIIHLYKAQKRVLKALTENRFVCLLAARQSGKTSLLCIYTLWSVCFNPDQTVLIVANKEATAISILRRIRLAYELLPNWLKPPVKEYGKTEVIFGNDSRIIVSTTTTTAALGESVSTLLIEECASIDPNLINEFWRSTIPTISASKKSKIFLVSTPRGTSNKFYEIYHEADTNKDSQWHAERMDWWDKPGRDEKWKETMLKTLGSQSDFDQEFGCTFFSSEDSTIDKEILEKIRTMCKDPKYILNDGNYKIWKDPNPEHIYSIGVDVGEGIGKTNSVITITDITDLQNIEIVAVYANNKIEPYHFAKVVSEIATQWGKPPLLIEKNSCGGQVIDALVNTHHYTNIVTYGSNSEKDRLGVYSHTNTKFTGVMNMRYWVNTLRIVSLYDASTLKELESFIRFPNGTWKKRSEDLFDDKVMSFIWSLLILDTDLCRAYYEVEELDDRGKPKKIKRITLDAVEFAKLPIASPYSDNAMPIFLGKNNETAKDQDISELVDSGWSFLR
jgi:hypothetical protein